MTNGDRIRSMSDEALAEWFNTNVNFCWQCDGRGTCAPAGSECKERIKKWLKREEAESAEDMELTQEQEAILNADMEMEMHRLQPELYEV